MSSVYEIQTFKGTEGKIKLYRTKDIKKHRQKKEQERQRIARWERLYAGIELIEDKEDKKDTKKSHVKKRERKYERVVEKE